MATKSIAEELLSCVSPYNYSKEISCLTTDDFVVLKQFPSSELGTIFTIDRSNCKQDGEINYAQLFELFGSFSDEDAESVHSDTMERIQTGSSVYEIVGKEFFEKQCTSFREWALSACNCYYYGDELLIYALCQIFHRHVVIACYDHLWTTIDNQHELTTGEILDVCDVRLAFLHPGIFGELKLKKCYGTMPTPSFDPSPPEFPSLV